MHNILKLMILLDFSPNSGKIYGFYPKKQAEDYMVSMWYLCGGYVGSM